MTRQTKTPAARAQEAVDVLRRRLAKLRAQSPDLEQTEPRMRSTYARPAGRLLGRRGTSGRHPNEVMVTAAAARPGRGAGRLRRAGSLRDKRTRRNAEWARRAAFGCARAVGVLRRDGP